MTQHQTRILELQRQLKIAKEALVKIKGGHRNSHDIADQALYDMMPMDPKYQLQGIVGHGNRKR